VPGAINLKPLDLSAVPLEAFARLTVRNTGSTLPERPKDFTPQAAEAMAKHDRRGA
jgi:hypothetical protein